jgi:PST family polysaccharide transporter
MCVLAIAAPHLVIAVYGPKWAGTVAPLQILCFAGYFRSLSHVGGVVAHSVGRVYSELWRQAVFAIFVIVAALIGSANGLRGVAIGVDMAILYMFLATGQLALQIVGSSWPEYLAIQRTAVLIAALTAAAGLVTRIALEHAAVGPTFAAGGILVASAIPWVVGVVWRLGTPELDLVQRHLPPFVRRMVRAPRSVL